MAVSILQSTGMLPWNFILSWRYEYYNLQWRASEIWHFCGGINIKMYSDVALKFGIVMVVLILQSTGILPWNLILLLRYQYYNLQGCYPEIRYYYGGSNITIYSDVALKFDIFVAVSILKSTGMLPWNFILLWRYEYYNLRGCYLEIWY